MSWIPTLEQARELMQAHNKEPFHRQHAETVSGVMAEFAKQLDPDHVEYWAAVGMLHDLDYEEQPERHCVAGREMLAPLDADPAFVRAIVCHGWGLTGADVEPELPMEKVLFAVDELTGLIGAAVKMRPSGSVQDLELKSLKKKFKSPSFAAGCNREVIAQGAERLGWTLDELLEKTILAMRAIEGKA